MRMPIADILHRGLVTSLFGLTLFGVFCGVAIHRETLQRGREMIAQKEAEAEDLRRDDAVDEMKEQALAAAAQSALHNPRSS